MVVCADHATTLTDSHCNFFCGEREKKVCPRLCLRGACRVLTTHERPAHHANTRCTNCSYPCLSSCAHLLPLLSLRDPSAFLFASLGRKKMRWMRMTRDLMTTTKMRARECDAIDVLFWTTALPPLYRIVAFTRCKISSIRSSPPGARRDAHLA
jgi:hypothetical protein